MKLYSENLIGLKVSNFNLPATDGKNYGLESLVTEKGLVVAFICNHCPYVKAIIGRLVADAKTLTNEGFGFVAISANDPDEYPEDSFPNMKKFAKEHNFNFPYLFDESQEVAKGFSAVCTPDIYGVSKDGIVKYHGRLHDTIGMNPPAEDAKRELVEAMRLIAETGEGPKDQKPSMGCSIKWKN